MIRIALLTTLALGLSLSAQTATTRFCLEGEFDLGARYQGTSPRPGEFYPATWCVVTEDDNERVFFSGEGKSNPDLDGAWTVAYFPPDLVRIVNRDDPPDIEFHDTDNAAEARSVRRLDPRRLVAEYRDHPERFTGMQVILENGQLKRLESIADFPLRGRVPVVWTWSWPKTDQPHTELSVDDTVIFRGTGRWMKIDSAQANTLWTATPGAEPVEVAGEFWPARVEMELINLTDDVYLVRGVRTGFRHMVIDTSEGLVVGDAPAGWVELHQLPPSDLVPGLGVSGLSEQLIDFLEHDFEGRPIAAVALTHFHDDHAGGARAFAAAGARVYAPAKSEAFLDHALTRPDMPPDRLSQSGSSIDVIPVAEAVTIGEGQSRARIVPLGAGPHVDASLGLLAPGHDYFFVSDIHVPNSDAETPRASRAETECWFAEKATNLLPASVRVVNSHSAAVTPVSRLQAYLESDACRSIEN